MRRTGETWLRMFVLLGTLAGLVWIAVFGGIVPRSAADDPHPPEHAHRHEPPSASSPFSSTVRRTVSPQPQARPVVDAAPRGEGSAASAVSPAWNAHAAAPSEPKLQPAAHRPPTALPSATPSGDGRSEAYWPREAPPTTPDATAAAGYPSASAGNGFPSAPPTSLDPRGTASGYPAAAVPAGYRNALDPRATPAGYPSTPPATGSAWDREGFAPRNAVEGVPPTSVSPYATPGAPPASLPPTSPEVHPATPGSAPPRRPARSGFPGSMESRADFAPPGAGEGYAESPPAPAAEASPFGMPAGGPSARHPIASASDAAALNPAAWRDEPAPRPAAAYETSTAALDAAEPGLAQPRRVEPPAADPEDWRRSPELPRLEGRLRAAGAVFYRLDRLSGEEGYRFVCQAGGDAGAPREFSAVAVNPLAAMRQVLVDVLADLNAPARPAAVFQRP